MDFRSAVRHSRGDHEGQCGRGGHVVELGGPSSDEFATSPLPWWRNLSQHQRLFLVATGSLMIQ